MELIFHNYFFVGLAALFCMGLFYLAFLFPGYIPHFLVIVFLVLPIFYDLTHLKTLPLTTVFVLVLLPFVLFKSSLHAIFRLWIFLPYIFSVFIACILNDVSLLERKSALIPIVISMICYLSFASSDNERPLNNFVYMLLIWGVLNSIFSILQIFVSDAFYVISVTKGYEMANIKRGYGLVGMATQVGLQFCFILPLSVAMTFERSHRKAIFYLISILVGTGLILSFSRAAILGACVSIAVVLFLLQKRKLLVLYLGMAFVLGASYVMYVHFLPHNYSSFLQGEDGSARARMHFVRIGINMFFDKPLWGWGYGGFSENVVRYGSPAKIEAHNTFIQVLVEYGIVGFSAFIFIILQSIKGYFRCFLNCKSRGMKVFSVGFFASLVSVLIDGYFHCFEWNLVFWVAIVMGFVMSSYDKKSLDCL